MFTSEIDMQMVVLSQLAKKGSMQFRDLMRSVYEELDLKLGGSWNSMLFRNILNRMAEAGLIRETKEPVLFNGEPLLVDKCDVVILTAYNHVVQEGARVVNKSIYDITEIGGKKRVDLIQDKQTTKSEDGPLPEGAVARLFSQSQSTRIR